MTFDPTELRGTPYGAPLVPPLPVRMRRVEILTVVYETDRDAVDALIPAPLVPAAARAALHVYWMHDAEWFGVYGESAVHLPVMLPDGRPGDVLPVPRARLRRGRRGGPGALRAAEEARRGGACAAWRSHGRHRRAQRDRDRHGDHLLQAAAGRRGRARPTAARLDAERQSPRPARGGGPLPSRTGGAIVRGTSPCTRRGPVRRRSSSGQTRRRRSTCCPFDGSSSASTGWSI